MSSVRRFPSAGCPLAFVSDHRFLLDHLNQERLDVKTSPLSSFSLTWISRHEGMGRV